MDADHVLYVGGAHGAVALDVCEAPAHAADGFLDLDALMPTAERAEAVPFARWAPAAAEAAIRALYDPAHTDGFARLWSDALRMDEVLLAEARRQREQAVHACQSSLQYLVEISSRERAARLAAETRAVQAHHRRWQLEVGRLLEAWAGAVLHLHARCARVLLAVRLAVRRLEEARGELHAHLGASAELDAAWARRCAETVDEEHARFRALVLDEHAATLAALRTGALAAAGGAWELPAAPDVDAVGSPQLSAYHRACADHVELQALASMLAVLARVDDALCADPFPADGDAPLTRECACARSPAPG